MKMTLLIRCLFALLFGLISCKSNNNSGLSFEELIRDELKNHNLTPEILCPNLLRFYVFNAEATFLPEQIQYDSKSKDIEKLVQDIKDGMSFFNQSMKKQFQLAKSRLVNLSPHRDNITIYNEGCAGKDVWTHHLLVFDGDSHGDSEVFMSSTFYRFQSQPQTQSVDFMANGQPLSNRNKELDLTEDMPLLLKHALDWIASKKSTIDHIEFVYSGHGGEVRVEEGTNVNPFTLTLEDQSHGSVIFDAHGPGGVLSQNNALGARYLNESLPKICAKDEYRHKSNICIEYQSRLQNPQIVSENTSGDLLQDITSGDKPQDITSGNTPQDITSGNLPQDITSGNTPQDITSGTIPQDFTSGNSPQAITSGKRPDYTSGGKSFHISQVPKTQLTFAENPVMIVGSSKMGTYMPAALPGVSSSFDFDGMLKDVNIQRVFSFLNSCNHHKENHTMMWNTSPIKMSYWTPSPIYTWAVDFGALSDFEMRAYLGIQFNKRIETKESLVDSFRHSFANNVDMVRTNIPKNAVDPQIKDEYIKVIVEMKTLQ